MTMKPDARALEILRRIHEIHGGDATILFGSRARGDHRPDSDIDLLLLTEKETRLEQEDQAEEDARKAAEEIYGDSPPQVQVVHMTTGEFLEEARYVNSMPTRALTEGTVLSTEPERFRSRYSGADPAEPEYDWSTYRSHMRKALNYAKKLGEYSELADRNEPSKHAESDAQLSGRRRLEDPEADHLRLMEADRRTAVRSALRGVREGLTAVLEASAEPYKYFACDQENLERIGEIPGLEGLRLKTNLGETPKEKMERGITTQEAARTGIEDIELLRRAAKSVRDGIEQEAKARRRGNAPGPGN